MHPIEFPYKKVTGGFAPIIPVKIHGRDQSSFYEAYVDSGAVISLFDSIAAELLQIDWRAGKRRPFIVGDGQTIYGYLVTLPFNIGGFAFRGPIAFSPDLKIGFNLLGRSGIFEYFSEVVFQEKKRKIIFRP